MLGLPPKVELWTKHPMLYGVSPTLLLPPKDWPDNTVLCGQWVPPLGTDFTPSTELTQFLAAGPEPIYQGFGSMAGIDLPRMLKIVIKALNGRRAVVWPGWSDIGSMTLPKNLIREKAVSHRSRRRRRGQTMAREDGLTTGLMMIERFLSAAST